jgi:hypothetical protein
MKKPASFQIATTIMQVSTVDCVPSQLWLPTPKRPRTVSSRP